jgi:hypothetical protein
MASMFACVMSISRRYHWNRCSTSVKKLIAGKAQILFGARILKENLQNESAISLIGTALNKAKLTLMVRGGWDQRASCKAYNSSSGLVVSVGSSTKKVCALVYYSTR